MVVLFGNGSADSAVAQPDVLKLTVRIYDYSNVPGTVLETAKREAERVYGSIGVETSWLNGKAKDVGPRTLTIIILDAPMRKAEKALADALGQAPRTPTERGSIAYVFYDRISRVSWRHERDLGRILGLVIGHELGHLLLPDDAHSETGVMRPTLNVDPFALAQQGHSFTASQAAFIRNELTEPRTEALMAPAGGEPLHAPAGRAPAGAKTDLDQ